MRKAQAFTSPFLLLLSLYFAQGTHSAEMRLGDNAGKLHLVRKIFIEISHQPGSEKEQRIELYLTRELERQGFTVIDSAADADAILSVTGWGEIVLDGDYNDPPPKSIYQFQLVLPNKKSIWKTKLKLVS